MSLISDTVCNWTAVDVEDSSPYECSYYAPDIVAMLSTQTRLDLSSWIRHPVGQRTGSYTPAGQNGWMKIIRQGHRVIQKPLVSVCTFEYAVTRVGTQQMLDWLAMIKTKHLMSRSAVDVEKGGYGASWAIRNLCTIATHLMGYGCLSPISKGDHEGVAAAEDVF